MKKREGDFFERCMRKPVIDGIGDELFQVKGEQTKIREMEKDWNCA